jgi:hypothetical protein
LLELVAKKGFVCLVLACFALAAGPVAAQEPEHAPPSQAEGEPPPFASEDSTDGPAASEPEPAPEEQTAPSDGRVRIRSVTKPEPTVAPEVEPVVEEAPTAEAPAPRERPDRRKRPESPERAVSTEAPPAAVVVPQSIAASAEAETPPAAKKRPDPSARSESLPARVVPRPVREIAEKVPTPVWLAVAVLALLAALFAASSWVAAARARRLRRQRAALLQEIGLLQEALLPSVPHDLPVSVAYRPAADASADGDFYDAFALPTGAIGLIVGSVSGHGRDTLGRTTFVRYTLRAHLDAGLEPREAVKVASDALEAHLDGGFATLTIAIYEPTTSRFTYASAGHPPPVVVGTKEEFDPVVACSAPPLGIGEPTGFRQSTFTLTAGARACLYTGGEDTELLLAALADHGDAAALLDAVADAADGIDDDMAVCLVTAPAGAPVTGPRIEELEVDDEYEVGDSLERFLRACGVPLADVPGVLREAGEAARRVGSVTVRVRMNDFRPGADVLPGNLVRLAERRRAVR